MNWFAFHLPDFAFSFLSILLEGVPFLLLGAVIAGLVEVFVPARWLTRLLPGNAGSSIFLSGLLGLIFPICECGSVVVIRRFLAKGLPLSAATAYMLAAPIVSPVVALSTYAAFRGQNAGMMTSLRLIIGYLVAVGVAFIIHQLRVGSVLKPEVIARLPGQPEGDGGRKRRLRIAALPAEGDLLEPSLGARWLRVARCATGDFLDVAFFFVIGSAVAALFNTAVDQSLILPLASHSGLATFSMMALSSLLALCSSTDAFIAATFVAFPFTAKLAFLIFGPLVDVKLFFLYGLLFRRRFVLLLSVGLFLAIGLICLQMTFLDA